jgi:hypothetical protein
MSVLLTMPLEQARQSFGPWGSQTTSVDSATTRWFVEGESVEHLFGALAWIPSGVSYRVEGDAMLLDALGDLAVRVAEAVSPR